MHAAACILAVAKSINQNYRSIISKEFSMKELCNLQSIGTLQISY